MARSAHGFSLIEILVALLIAGILAAAAIPVFKGHRDSARNADAKEMLRNAWGAYNTFYASREAFTGLNGAMFPSLEATLHPCTYAAADAPGPGRDPSNIGGWIDNALDGQYVQLYNASAGSRTYAIATNYSDTLAH